MRKYLEVFRWSFKMQIVWRFDVAITMVATIGKILAAWILWSAAFSGKDSVAGFTLSAMLGYYILAAVLSSLDKSHQISFEVSDLIKDGGFSKHMVMPANPLSFFGSMVLGQSAFHLLFAIAAATLCLPLFGIDMALAPDAPRIALGLTVAMAGYLFKIVYHFFLGTLTFRFLEINFFLHAQSAIVDFATGSMVPLSLLPGAVVGVLGFMPFTHVVFTPAMLLTGQMGIAEGLFGLAVLLIWVAVMLILSQMMYKTLRVRYEGVGI